MEGGIGQSQMGKEKKVEANETEKKKGKKPGEARDPESGGGHVLPTVFNLPFDFPSLSLFPSHPFCTSVRIGLVSRFDHFSLET